MGTSLLLVLHGGSKWGYGPSLQEVLSALAPHLQDATWLIGWDGNGVVEKWSIQHGKLHRVVVAESGSSVEDHAVGLFPVGSPQWRRAVWFRIEEWADIDGEQSLADLAMLARHGESGPRHVMAVARSHLTEEEPAETLRVLQPLLSLDTPPTEALELAVRAAQQTGALDAALAWSRARIQAGRHAPGMAQHAAMLLEHGDVDEALRWARPVLGMASSDALATALLVQARAEARRACVEDALRAAISYITCCGAPHVRAERLQQLADDPGFARIWSCNELYQKILGDIPKT